MVKLLFAAVLFLSLASCTDIPAGLTKLESRKEQIYYDYLYSLGRVPAENGTTRFVVSALGDQTVFEARLPIPRASIEPYRNGFSGRGPELWCPKGVVCTIEVTCRETGQVVCRAGGDFASDWYHASHESSLRNGPRNHATRYLMPNYPWVPGGSLPSEAPSVFNADSGRTYDIDVTVSGVRDTSMQDFELMLMRLKWRMTL